MSQNSLSIEPFCSPTTWKMSDIFHDLAWKISNFFRNYKLHRPSARWHVVRDNVFRYSRSLAATRVAASEQVTDQTCPVTASDRRGQVAASDRKWPQVTASGRFGQLAASGRMWPLLASGRKWPLSASAREWPQVAAFSNFKFHT